MTESSIAKTISPLLNHSESDVENWIKFVYLRIAEDLLLEGRVFINDLGLIEKEYIPAEIITSSNSQLVLIPPRVKVRFNSIKRSEDDVFYNVAISNLFLDDDTARRFSHAFNTLIERTLLSRTEFVMGNMGVFFRLPSGRLSFEVSDWIENILDEPYREYAPIPIIKELGKSEVFEVEDNALERQLNDIISNEVEFEEESSVSFLALNDDADTISKKKPFYEEKSDTQLTQSINDTERNFNYLNETEYHRNVNVENNYEKIGSSSEIAAEENDDNENVLVRKKIGIILSFVLVSASVGYFIFYETSACITKENSPVVEKIINRPDSAQKIKHEEKKVEVKKKPEKKSVKKNIHPKDEKYEEVITQEKLEITKGMSEFDYTGSYWTIIIFSSPIRQEADKTLKDKSQQIPTPYSKELSIIQRTENGQKIFNVCLGGYKNEDKEKAEKLMKGLLDRNLTDESQTKLYFVK